jgi:hypothetical protein
MQSAATSVKVSEAEAIAHVQSKLALSRFTAVPAVIDVGNGEPVVVPHHIFQVAVTLDPEAKVYVAVCEELGLVAEAENIDSLTGAVESLVPEMMMENGIGKPGEHYCIEFTEHQPA